MKNRIREIAAQKIPVPKESNLYTLFKSRRLFARRWASEDFKNKPIEHQEWVIRTFKEFERQLKVKLKFKG